MIIPQNCTLYDRSDPLDDSIEMSSEMSSWMFHKMPFEISLETLFVKNIGGQQSFLWGKWHPYFWAPDSDSPFGAAAEPSLIHVDLHTYVQAFVGLKPRIQIIWNYPLAVHFWNAWPGTYTELYIQYAPLNSKWSHLIWQIQQTPIWDISNLKVSLQRFVCICQSIISEWPLLSHRLLWFWWIET